VGVIGVQFQLDGGNLGAEVSSPPYSVSWDTSQTANGSHVLTATARDAAGNHATSSSVTVTVSNTQLRPYTTNFPLTENPIFEGNNWVNGKTNGVDWADVQTTPGLAFGTNAGGYADPTALVAGSWAPDQMEQATVHSVNQNDNIYEEVELRLRSQISSRSNTGYEINFRCSKTGNAYSQIVRWNGPLGNFSYLWAGSGSQYGVADGDVVKATIVGNLITAYINGVQIAQVSDSTFPTGSPGMGFYLSGATGINSDYGFTNFMASDGVTSDTSPPTVPTNLAAIVISASQIDLTWSASTDNVAVAGYQVFRNNVQIATTAGTGYSDKSVAPGIQYTYTVSAFDAAGNISAQSAPVIAQTSSDADTTPPSIPNNLQSSNLTSTSVSVSWSASTDNVGVAGYKIFRAGTQVGTSATNSYSDSGLTASTAYTYTVSAYDAAGNNSAASSAASATTQASTGSTKFSLNDRVQVSSGPLNVRATANTTGTLLGTQATNITTHVITQPHRIATKANVFLAERIRAVMESSK